MPPVPIGVSRPLAEMFDTGLAAGNDSRKGVVAGWGLTKEDGRPSDTLLEVSDTLSYYMNVGKVAEMKIP